MVWLQRTGPRTGYRLVGVDLRLGVAVDDRALHGRARMRRLRSTARPDLSRRRRFTRKRFVYVDLQLQQTRWQRRSGIHRAHFSIFYRSLGELCDGHQNDGDCFRWPVRAHGSWPKQVGIVAQK